MHFEAKPRQSNETIFYDDSHSENDSPDLMKEFESQKTKKESEKIETSLELENVSS